MPKKRNNTIHKLFLRSKTIIAILNSITRIGLIIYIKHSEEAFSVDHVHIEEDTEVEETTMADITTTSYLARSNAISVIKLDAG